MKKGAAGCYLLATDYTITDCLEAVELLSLLWLARCVIGRENMPCSGNNAEREYRCGVLTRSNPMHGGQGRGERKAID